MSSTTIQKTNSFVTNRFDNILSLKIQRFLNMQIGFTLNLLAKIVSIIRFFLRFEMLRAVQRKLHRMYRDRMAEARSLPPVLYPEVEMIPAQIKVPDEDVVLNGNLYLPVEALEGKMKVPAVLIRTPYDKDAPLLGPGIAITFAERGYACLIQDTRGRFGSGGDFFPIKHEVKDGTVTVEWLRKQSWCTGKVGTFGVSYLGLTAYAAAGGGQSVDACVPVMACSRLYPLIYHGGNAFAYDLVVRWLWLVINVMQEKNPIKKIFKILTPRQQLQDVLHPVGTKPVHHRDHDIVGKEMDFYRQVMESHDLGHEFWTEKDMLCDLSNPKTSPPLSIIAGWHDMFVAQTFKDFEVAAAVKTDAPLTMMCGPWSHWDFMHYSNVGFHLAFDLFKKQLKGEDAFEHDDDFDPEAGEGHNRPTRIYVQVMHSETSSNPRGTWMKFHSWPPVHRTKPVEYYLGSDGRLSTKVFTDSKPHSDQVYDPRDPTPHYGGPGFDWLNSGRMVQNDLEHRDDVLVFTSPVLQENLVVVGEVKMKVHFWSNNRHTDLFVKVCDVEGNTQKSLNVMEKMTRLSEDTEGWDEEGNITLDIDVGPIAVEFKKGNRVRIQVSGAAHPLYLRSNGTGDHLSLDMKPALRKIKHSAQYPTVLVLPVLQ